MLNFAALCALVFPLSTKYLRGANIRPPWRFLVDSGKTAARSAAKFGMTIPSFLFYILCASCKYLP